MVSCVNVRTESLDASVTRVNVDIGTFASTIHSAVKVCDSANHSITHQRQDHTGQDQTDQGQ